MINLFNRDITITYFICIFLFVVKFFVSLHSRVRVVGLSVMITGDLAIGKQRSNDE